MMMRRGWCQFFFFFGLNCHKTNIKLKSARAEGSKRPLLFTRANKRHLHIKAMRIVSRRTYLLKSNEGTTDLRGSEFRIVEWYNHRQTTHADSGHESSSKNVIVRAIPGVGLDDDTDAEPDDGEDDTALSADGIRDITVEEHTEPCAELEDGSEETGQGRVLDTSDTTGLGERVHAENLTEHSLVVTVDQTTHGSEDGDEEGTSILEESCGTGGANHRKTVVSQGLGDMVLFTDSGGGHDGDSCLDDGGGVGGGRKGRKEAGVGKKGGWKSRKHADYFYLFGTKGVACRIAFDTKAYQAHEDIRKRSVMRSAAQ